MERIKKHKRHIIYIIILSILLTVGNLIVLEINKTYGKYSLALNISLLVTLLMIYYKVRRLCWVTKKEFERINNTLSPENVTIEQVINPKHEETDENIQYNKNSFNNLIEQFNKIDDPVEIAKIFLSRMSKEFEIVQGLFYQYNSGSELFEPIADYAFYGEEEPRSFKIGEGLNGQVARDQKTIYLKELPGQYRQIISGLGKREPKYMVIIPIVSNENTVAIVELSLFNHLDTSQISILENILNNLCRHFEKIK